MATARRWSLRTRFIALLLASLIPFAGLVGFWVIREVWDVRAQVERETQGTAALIAAEVGRLVVGIQEMLTVLARIPATQARDRRVTSPLFRELLATSPHLENIFMLGPDGVLLASAIPIDTETRVSVRHFAWFQAVIRSGQPVVSGFHVGPISDQPVASIAVPILDGQGRLVGVVSALLRLAGISQEVAPGRISAPVLWAVVDRQSVVLLHSELWGRIGKPLGALSGMLSGEAIVPATPWRAIVAVPETMVASQARPTGSRRSRATNRFVSSASARIR